MASTDRGEQEAKPELLGQRYIAPGYWDVASLEDVASILDSYREPINNKERQERIAGKSEDELYPYYGATGQVGYIDDYKMDGRYVLLGEDGAPFLEPDKSKAYIVNGKIWVNNHAHILAPRIDTDYFCFYLNSVDYAPVVTGTTRLKLNQRAMRKIAIAIPPLREQRRIVAKIEELFSELDKGMESLKTARAQLKTYRQSLLKTAFEGRLTEQWRHENADEAETAEQLLERIHEEREARHQQRMEEWKSTVAEWETNGKAGKKPRKPTVEKPLPEFTEDEVDVLPRLPKEWKYVRLATLAAVGSGMAVSKSRTLEDPVEVPYLRVANVQRGKLTLDEVKTMAVERTSLNDFRLKTWDVLFNEGGDRDKLGRGWVWEGQIDPCITQNHVFRATTYLGDKFHAKFISYWGNVFGRDYFEKVGKQTTNLASINKSVLKMFPVPVLSYAEQREIVRRIEEAESHVAMLEEQLEDGLNRAKSLRQSILKCAFEGKLVPQDPDDEPASALLERIRQEQADAPKPKPKRRKRKTGAPA